MMPSTSTVTSVRSTMNRARRLPTAAVVALLAAGLLGACSDDAPEAAPTGGSVAPTDGSVAPTGGAPDEIVADAGDIDACALLPQAELDAILGEAGTATPVPGGGWVAGQCAWSGPETGFLLSIGTGSSIAASDNPAEADAAAKLAAFSTRQADEAREVPETGDEAVAGPSGVAARVGSTYLELEVLSLPDEQPEQIMQLAVDNLPSS